VQLLNNVQSIFKEVLPIAMAEDVQARKSSTRRGYDVQTLL
jgi:hypothetical protein